MPYLYETLLIVTPEADDDGVNAVIGDLRTTIEADGAKVLQAGVWQRRQLAYPVMGKTEGIYILVYADGEVTLPAALEDRMKLDESVMRSLVVRLEDKQEADVRAQIAESGDADADAERQREAAERRAQAAAEAAAMSLDEIAAAAAAAEVAADESETEVTEPIGEDAAPAVEGEVAAFEGEAADAADVTDAAPEGFGTDDVEPSGASDDERESRAGEEERASGPDALIPDETEVDEEKEN